MQIPSQKAYKKGVEDQEKTEVEQEKEARSHALVTSENPEEVQLGLLTKKKLTKKQIMQLNRNRRQQTDQSNEEPPAKTAKGDQGSKEMEKTITSKREQEKRRVADAVRLVRQNEEQRKEEKSKDAKAKRLARLDKEKRGEEKRRDTAAKRLARLDEEKREEERCQSKEIGQTG